MDVLKPKIGGGSGLLREEFIIHLSDRMKIIARYWIAPSSDPDRKHINLAQAMRYLQVIEDHRLQLVQLVRIPVLRPTITIIIGRSNSWTDAMKEQLRILNSTLLNIKVLTYDHLLAMGNNILQLYAPEDEDEIPF